MIGARTEDFVHMSGPGVRCLAAADDAVVNAPTGQREPATRAEVNHQYSITRAPHYEPQYGAC